MSETATVEALMIPVIVQSSQDPDHFDRIMDRIEGITSESDE